jgi:hypothetical protein
MAYGYKGLRGDAIGSLFENRVLDKNGLLTEGNIVTLGEFNLRNH